MTKGRNFLLSMMAICASQTVAAQGETKTEVQFYAPGIVRVVKYPAELKAMPEKKSYTVIMTPEKVDVSESTVDGAKVYASSTLKVKVDGDGCLLFTTANGDTLLSEKGKPLFTMRKGDCDEGKYIVAQSWQLAQNEAIFGLGQRKDGDLNQRGKHVKLWNINTVTTIPVITSEKGYGLFWDNMSRSYFDDDSNGTTFKSEVATMIDYYFVYRNGTTDGVISCLRSLTGKATMFPLWAMGHWQSRERYKTSDELAEVLDKYRQLEIPLDGIVQDWQYWGCDSNWNAMRFMNPYYINKVGDKAWAKYLPADMRNMKVQGEPRLKTPEAMAKYVHDNNAHLMITIWPTFGPWTKQYAELEKIGALLPFTTWPMNCGAKAYDVFNPKARDIYWKHLTNLYNIGFDAWWTDSTEPDHFEQPGDDEIMTYDGSWRSVKNAYAIVHNRGIYEHQRKKKGNTHRSIQMTRSGQLGIQHYGTFSWSGDIVSTWDEMRRQVPSGLNYSICGIPFWNTDISGFFGGEFNNDPKNPAMQELQVRWLQWGTFLPLMRKHCSSPMVSEIYKAGNPGDWAYDIQKSFVELRYRLLPYIYSTQGDVVLNDGSMMRPLVMDFANDKRAINLSDEYLFGRALLVKPITQPLYTWKDENKNGHLTYPDIRKAAAAVDVYLPKGTAWYDFWTNEKLDGGKSIVRPCPIDIMPVYVKAGAILPWGPAAKYSTEKTWDNLEIRIYKGADGSFTLYEDRGDGYEYEKGEYTLIPFSWSEASSTLTIGKRTGKFPTMIKTRKFQIVVIDNGKAQEPKAIDYNGEEIAVKL